MGRSPTLIQLSDLKDPLHFIGIGGSGMAPLAELALRHGLRVQGSDVRSSATIEHLEALGIKIDLSQRGEALDSASTVIHSTAIQPQNQELIEARDRNLKILHRSAMLSALMNEKKPITVAGTHGKSTTSAMIVHMLTALGLDPEAALGGTMRELKSAARFGHGTFFVAEADESDGSFMLYKPFIGVVTNIDQDHMEFFKDLTQLSQAFTGHLHNIQNAGFAVLGYDSATLRQASSNLKIPKVSFGFSPEADIQARNYQCLEGQTTFDALIGKTKDALSCKIPTLGQHNVQNALACLSVAKGLNLNLEDAAKALASFDGVERRLSLVHQSSHCTIFDDYAHNPGKIAACVAAIRSAFPQRTLHVIYQPHRFSRLETMYNDMLQAVRLADIVYMVPVYSAGETTSHDFSPERLAKDLTGLTGIKTFACQNLEKAQDAVLAEIKAPSVVLTVGAGDVWVAALALKHKLGSP